MISQGPDELNIIVGVENKDFNRAVAALYETFAAEAKEVRAQQAQNA